MSFGKALYYPSIEINNIEWLKTALLYWDDITRIVPSGYIPQDSDDIKRIKGELGLINNIEPNAGLVYSASESFFDWLFDIIENPDTIEYYFSKHKAYYKRRYKGYQERYKDPELLKKVLGKMAEDGNTYINVNKLSPELKDILCETGIAKQGNELWESWIKVDDEIGIMYMSFLARSISQETNQHSRVWRTW